jgi:hypothetical protein
MVSTACSTCACTRPSATKAANRLDAPISCEKSELVHTPSGVAQTSAPPHFLAVSSPPWSAT